MIRVSSGSGSRYGGVQLTCDFLVIPPGSSTLSVQDSESVFMKSVGARRFLQFSL